MKDIQIRPAGEHDFDAMWSIFCSHVAAGETYPFTTATSREAGHAYWLGPEVTSFFATSSGSRVLGMYRLVATRAGRAHHVEKPPYRVSPAAQGAGVGRTLGEHSRLEEKRQGSLPMQSN